MAAFIKLVAEADLWQMDEDQLKIHLFVQALEDEELRKEIFQRTDLTFEGLIDLVEEYDAVAENVKAKGKAPAAINAI